MSKEYERGLREEREVKNLRQTLQFYRKGGLERNYSRDVKIWADQEYAIERELPRDYED